MTARSGKVQRKVRAQAQWIAVAAFTVMLPAVLAALLVASGWTAYVNVAAIHSYLDKPNALPGVALAVPVAVQIAILAGEATMVLNAILRRWWILLGGAMMAIGGYAVEITVHLQHSETDTWALIVAAVACGGGWALVAGLMHRGVEIANEDGTEDTAKGTSKTSAWWSRIRARDTAEDTPQGHPEDIVTVPETPPSRTPSPAFEGIVRDAFEDTEGHPRDNTGDTAKDTPSAVAEDNVDLHKDTGRYTFEDAPQGHPEDTPEDSGDTMATAPRGRHSRRSRALTKDTAKDGGTSLAHLTDEQLTARVHALTGPLSVRRISREFKIGKDRAGSVLKAAKFAAEDTAKDDGEDEAASA
ncbi:hypothetical protein ACIG3E_11390 [Streptomyces sp. NPDC053474]|uniref:hypothetical protein n=1 Tax=Streptomyces sp. NPDC053474 TaxID=3365704 RepID=UPI0037D4A232